MIKLQSNVSVTFVKITSRKEPLKDWIVDLPEIDRIKILNDLKRIQNGIFTIRSPKIRNIKGVKGLWEIKCNLPSKNTARLIFCIKNQVWVILHWFIKKTNKTPKKGNCHC